MKKIISLSLLSLVVSASAFASNADRIVDQSQQTTQASQPAPQKQTQASNASEKDLFTAGEHQGEKAF